MESDTHDTSAGRASEAFEASYYFVASLPVARSSDAGTPNAADTCVHEGALGAAYVCRERRLSLFLSFVCVQGLYRFLVLELTAVCSARPGRCGRSVGSWLVRRRSELLALACLLGDGMANRLGAIDRWPGSGWLGT